MIDDCCRTTSLLYRPTATSTPHNPLTVLLSQGAKKKDDTERSEDAYSEWNNTHHVTSAARDNHVFGYGLGGAGRHEQIINGTTPMEVFEKKDAPLPTSTAKNFTNWRDDPEAIPRRRRRKGRPQGSEGVEAFDIDGDGMIDESEVLISSFMKNEHNAHNPTWEGESGTHTVPFHSISRTSRTSCTLRPVNSQLTSQTHTRQILCGEATAQPTMYRGS